MTSLTEIADHYGTDKGSRGHNYTAFYERLFKGMRSKPVKTLEIGVAGGESIKMWADWFYNKESRIYGVEIENRPLPEFDDRTQIFITNAALPNAVFDITNVTGPIDILVDDSSHRSNDLKDVLRLWWPHISPGGMMVFEDLHAQFKYPWTDEGEIRFTDSLQPWIDRVHENGANDSGVPSTGDVEEIIMRKSLLVIKKRLTLQPV